MTSATSGEGGWTTEVTTVSELTHETFLDAIKPRHITCPHCWRCDGEVRQTYTSLSRIFGATQLSVCCGAKVLHG